MAWSPHSLRSRVSTQQQNRSPVNPSQYNDLSIVDEQSTQDVLYEVPNDRMTPFRSGQTSAARPQSQASVNQLDFLQLSDWIEHNSYEENTPTYIHYSVEWQVTLNNKVISKDTEQDLVLAPTAYWHIILKPKLDMLTQRKLEQNQGARCDDTNVVVCVNHRSQRDLTKRFNEVDIDWSVIERKLLAWGDLLRDGRKLRVNLSVNYVDAQPATTAVPRRGGKLGSSTTRRMIAERAAQLDSEEDSTGSPSIWQKVYSLTRCPGRPCVMGPHYWRDAVGKKHYKLRTQHLKSLTDFIAEGYTLQSHADIPEYLREELIAEEQQRLERQPRYATAATPNYPPMNITNVLPASESPPAATSADPPLTTTMSTTSIPSLNILGP